MCVPTRGSNFAELVTRIYLCDVHIIDGCDKTNTMNQVTVVNKRLSAGPEMPFSMMEVLADAHVDDVCEREVDAQHSGTGVSE